MAKAKEKNPHAARSFRNKLLAYYMLCAAVPVVIVGILAFVIAYTLSRQSTIDSAALTGREMSARIDGRLNQVERVADSILYYMYTLENTPRTPQSGFLNAYELAKDNISALGRAFDTVHVSVFVSPDLLISDEGFSFYGFDELDSYGVALSDFTERGTSPMWRFSPAQRFPYDVAPHPLPVLTCFRGKVDVVNRSAASSHVYAISLACGEFCDMLAQVYTGQGITGALVETATGTVLAHPDPALVGTPVAAPVKALLEAGAGSGAGGGEQFLLHTIHGGQFALVTGIYPAYIYANLPALIAVMAVGLAAVLALTVVVVAMTTRNITARLSALTGIIARTGSAMDAAQAADAAALVPADKANWDEIDLLASTYADMLATIRTNFEQILKMTTQEQLLKYQLLYAQINPHFLYNVLQSIRTCQSLGRIDTAGEMTDSLARFYRYILRKPDKITIREELEIVALYLGMERHNHNNTLSWSIEADEGTEEFLICKFSLQPLVENAILHGMSSSAQAIHIAVAVAYQDDDVAITVTDDGQGLPPERLAELRRMIDAGAVDNTRNFGLCNVAARLRSAFPLRGRLAVHSTRGEGTRVSIVLEQQY